jgi:hypothetical protein
MIYGAGGGNFIGVIVGVDVNSGVGDAGGDSDGDSVALGDSKGTAVAFACGDDVAGRDLEARMSEIRAILKGTMIAAHTALFVQSRIVSP